MGTQAAAKLDNSLFVGDRLGDSPPNNEARLWYELSSPRTCPEGEELLRQGASPHGVYYIDGGYVKLSRMKTQQLTGAGVGVTC